MNSAVPSLQGFDVGPMLGGAVIYILLLIAAFLITRWFWCWYFKLNRIERLLEEIRDKIK